MSLGSQERPEGSQWVSLPDERTRHSGGERQGQSQKWTGQMHQGDTWQELSQLDQR